MNGKRQRVNPTHEHALASSSSAGLDALLLGEHRAGGDEAGHDDARHARPTRLNGQYSSREFKDQHASALRECFQFQVLALALVLTLDVGLGLAFWQVNQDTGEPSEPSLWDSMASKVDGPVDQVVGLSLVRVFVNIAVFIALFRWGVYYRNVQSEGLALFEAESITSIKALKWPVVPNKKDDRYNTGGQDAPETPEIRAYKVRRKVELWRYSALAIAFLVNTSVSFYMSIQCVLFDFDASSAQAPILFSIVILSSCEFFVLKLACDAVSTTRGCLLPNLHSHKLYFWNNLTLHWCDVCFERIDGKAWRCKRCDFDTCYRCYREFLEEEHDLEESHELGQEGVLGGSNDSTRVYDNESNERERGDTIVSTVSQTNAGAAVSWLSPDAELESVPEPGVVQAHIPYGRARGRSRTHSAPLRNPTRRGQSGQSLERLPSSSTVPNEELRNGPAALPPSASTSRGSAYLAAWRLICQYRASICVAAASLVLSAAAKIGVPNFSGSILIAVFDQDMDKFHTNILQLGLCTGILIGFGVIRDGVVAALGRKIATQVRNDMFAGMLSQEVEFFDSTMTGHLTAALTNDVNAMVAPWKTLFTAVLVDIFVTIGGLTMCTITSWRLTAVALSCLLPITYLASLYALWSTKINREIWSGISDANSVATEVLRSIRTIKIFDSEKLESKRFRESTDNALSKGLKDALGAAATTAATQHLSMIGAVLIFSFGGWEAISHPERLSPGQLVTFQLYWSLVSDAYKDLCEHINDLSRANAALVRVFGVLLSLKASGRENARRRMTQVGQVVAQAGGGVAIHFSNVSFSYPNNNNVTKRRNELDRLEMVIPANALVAIAGKSGAGKTSVFRLLLRIYEPASGSIFVNGAPLAFLNRRQYRRNVALVAPNDLCLFSATIGENIAYGLDPDDYTAEDIVQAAKAAQAHGFIMKTRMGYQTKLSEHGEKLSLGEKARIAIARALLRKPKLLLLDEPFANLDLASVHPVFDAIRKLLELQKATVVLITHHDSEILRQASRIFVLGAGTVVEQGDFATLTANPRSKFSKLLNKHQEVSPSFSPTAM